MNSERGLQGPWYRGARLEEGAWKDEMKTVALERQRALAPTHEAEETEVSFCPPVLTKGNCKNESLLTQKVYDREIYLFSFKPGGGSFS